MLMIFTRPTKSCSSFAGPHFSAIQRKTHSTDNFPALLVIKPAFKKEMALSFLRLEKLLSRSLSSMFQEVCLNDLRYSPSVI